MIKIEDFIPHRQLINHALRKASNDLKVQISSYQARYEQKVAECKKEVAIEIERKKQHFEKIKQSYVDQLTSESVALEGVKELFFKYVDVYRERQVLMYHKEKIGQEIALRKEHYDFLGEQKRLIEADIEILTDRKDILSKQSSVDDIIALIQLSSSTVECTSDDNAKSLLDKVNDVLYGGKDTNEATRSLLRLRTLLHERAEYLSVIQYISWLIQQKETLKRELINKRNQLQAERKSLFTAKDELDCQIKEKNEVLQDYANEVRNIWAKPLADLLIEQARIEAELTESYDELQSVREALKRMMDESSDDSDRWERLQSAKRNYKENISTLKSQKESIKGQKDPWNKQRNRILNICKSNNIYLLAPKDGYADEIRILLSRKEELLSQIDDLSKACEQEKDKKQSDSRITSSGIESQIEVLRTQEATIKQRLTNANRDIAAAEKRDSRGFFARILSDSYEVVQAKEKKNTIARELSQVQGKLNDARNKKQQYSNEMEKSLAEIDQTYQRKIRTARNAIVSIDRAIEYDKERKNRRKKVTESESKV